MSLLDPRNKTINLKVVYYGPGLGGKTTSLKHIHQVIDPEGRVKLVSLDTDEDRTLFFDFLPIEVGLVGRFKVKMQGFTVPGQVKYNMTRRYVLTGADGIVFVADSDPSRVVENVESLINLGDNLRAHGLNVNSIPLVFQYNKQDLENAVEPAELDEKLNFRKVPSVATIATRGDGVFEAFIAVSRLMVSRVIKTYNLKEERAEEDRVLDEVEQRLRVLGSGGADRVPARGEAAAAVGARVEPERERPGARSVLEPVVAAAGLAASGRSSEPPETSDATEEEALDFFESFVSGETPAIARAAGASTERPRKPEAWEPARSAPAARPSAPGATSERLEPVRLQEAEAVPGGLARSKARSERCGAPVVPRSPRDQAAAPAAGPRLGNVLRSMLEIGRGIAAGCSLEKSATLILSAACQAFDAAGGSLLALEENGSGLRPLFLCGFRKDPLLVAREDAGRELLDLLQRGGDQLLITEDHNPEIYGPLRAVSPAAEAAVLVPLLVGTRIGGAMVVYLDEPLNLTERKDALKMLMVLACQAAVALRLNGTS